MKNFDNNRSWLRQVLLRPLLAGLMLFCTAAAVQAGDSYDPTTNQLTIGSVQIGNATYSNMVVTVNSTPPFISGPAGIAPNALIDSYNPANQELTVSSVTIGTKTYYNVIVPVTGLVSIGGVSGADTYDSTAHQLTIGSVQVGNRAGYLEDSVVGPGG